MDTQLKKGILEMCILYQIRDDILYGYEIMKSVQQVFPDVYEGSIYAILRRIHAAGYANVIKRESPSGPPRKYYEITESGKEYLNQMLHEWRNILQGVTSLGIQ
ncbi:MAG TPA: PadR family transcriptional regulator [Clostridiales bacterium]|nr:PadR family transcriptional regulator [Clostridiales bacterium]